MLPKHMETGRMFKSTRIRVKSSVSVNVCACVSVAPVPVPDVLFALQFLLRVEEVATRHRVLSPPF